MHIDKKALINFFIANSKKGFTIDDLQKRLSIKNKDRKQFQSTLGQLRREGALKSYKPKQKNQYLFTIANKHNAAQQNKKVDYLQDYDQVLAVYDLCRDPDGLFIPDHRLLAVGRRMALTSWLL